jgi:hypothetical protein
MNIQHTIKSTYNYTYIFKSIHDIHIVKQNKLPTYNYFIATDIIPTFPLTNIL